MFIIGLLSCVVKHHFYTLCVSRTPARVKMSLRQGVCTVNWGTALAADDKSRQRTHHRSSLLGRRTTASLFTSNNTVAVIPADAYLKCGQLDVTSKTGRWCKCSHDKKTNIWIFIGNWQLKHFLLSLPINTAAAQHMTCKYKQRAVRNRTCDWFIHLFIIMYKLYYGGTKLF